MASFTVEDRGEERWVLLDGDLDHVGSQGLTARLLETADGWRGPVVLDLNGVTFVGSPGLRVMLAAYHHLDTRGRLLSVAGLRPGVRQVFLTTGIFEAIPERDRESEPE